MKTPEKIVLSLLAGVMLVLSQGCCLKVAEKPNTKVVTVAVTGTGRPMILIPGIACGGDVWDDAVVHFKNTYQCHVVSLAGFAGQPGISGPFLERVRDALITYINEQKLDRPIIVGHSLGGFVGVSLGASIPDQVGPIISVDAVPFALKNTHIMPRWCIRSARLARMLIAMQTSEGFAKSNQKMLGELITDPKEVQRIADSSNKSDPKAVGEALFELVTVDIREKLNVIQTPVLLLGASIPIANLEKKKLVEEEYSWQIATIPNHSVVFAPHARHFVMLDDPKFFFQEVESFLKAADKVKAQ